MGVQLRVVLPGGRLAERRHGQAVSVGVLAGAVDPHPGGGAVALDVLEHGPHRDVVRLEQPGIAGEPPPHRQRLRRRERGVEPGHGGDQPALGVVRGRRARRPSRVPVVGSWPDSSASRSSVDTVPDEAEAVGLAAQPLPLAVRARPRPGSGCSSAPRPRRCWRGWSSPAARDPRRRRRALVCRADRFGPWRGRGCASSARGEQRELRGTGASWGAGTWAARLVCR